MAFSTIKIAILIVVGPAEQEIDRLRDTLESAFALEPAITQAVIVDDSLHSRSLDRATRTTSGPLTHAVLSERRQQGNGVYGGLCENILLGCRELLRIGHDFDFVVKLDTDALVVRPFAEKLIAEFAQNPRAAILGSVNFEPDGQPRDRTPWNTVTRRLTQYGAMWLRSPRSGNLTQYFSQSFWGPHASIRKRIRTARASGYEWGKHQLGGAYACRKGLIDSLQANGCLEDRFIWRRVHMSEDVLMAMYAATLGYELADSYLPGAVFANKYKRLHAPPDQIMAGNWSIVHSVRDCFGMSEKQLRAYFRAQRESLAGPESGRHSSS